MKPINNCLKNNVFVEILLQNGLFFLKQILSVFNFLQNIMINNLKLQNNFTNFFFCISNYFGPNSKGSSNQNGAGVLLAFLYIIEKNGARGLQVPETCFAQTFLTLTVGAPPVTHVDGCHPNVASQKPHTEINTQATCIIR